MIIYISRTPGPAAFPTDFLRLNVLVATVGRFSVRLHPVILYCNCFFECGPVLLRVVVVVVPWVHYLGLSGQLLWLSL